VSEPIEVTDLSPMEGLTHDELEWLADLQGHLRSSDHQIRLGETEREEDFVISRDARGKWWTGRYIGEIAYNGRRLRITPRLGDDKIIEWMAGALNLAAVPETATHTGSDAFIARLMAAVWCRAVDTASRHGPPAFRRVREHEGLYVRGRFDPRRTARLRGRGSPHVASETRPRDLDNDISRTLVVAERVLSQHIGSTTWRTPRVRQVLPQLIEAVGARPRLPRESDLGRIRYTPITRPFKAVAELSWRIAQQQGFAVAQQPGRAEGLLLDVAELWELFLLHCMRRALPRLRVEHGTTAGDDAHLLESRSDPGKRIGRLKPDILIRDGGEVVGVFDAKYKQLANRWPDRRDGIDRADLYQLTTYLARHDPLGQAAGGLLYPRDDDRKSRATAEDAGPWRAPTGSHIQFVQVSHDEQAAVRELGEMLASSGVVEAGI